MASSDGLDVDENLPDGIDAAGQSGILDASNERSKLLDDGKKANTNHSSEQSHKRSRMPIEPLGPREGRESNLADSQSTGRSKRLRQSPGTSSHREDDNDGEKSPNTFGRSGHSLSMVDQDELLGASVHKLASNLERPSFNPGEDSSRGNDMDIEQKTPSDQLRDVVKYFMARNRIRGGIRAFGWPERCRECNKLDLTPEKFIVSDREKTLQSFIDASVDSNNSRGPFNAELGSRTYELGTLQSIWTKSSFCPFCLGIMQTFGSKPGFSWIDPNSMPSESVKQRYAKELMAKCCLSWQIDGKEVTHNANGRIGSIIARTRRIRIEWKPDVSFGSSFLVLMSDYNPRSQDFLGRRSKVNRGSSLALNNINIMKDWIRTCEAEHGEVCTVSRSARFRQLTRQAFFGVIDVKDMCLTALPENEPFIALSYTWGNVEPDIKLHLRNVRDLRSTNHQKNLVAISSKLPKTILDAIRLTDALDQRYLWVDSLCIIQDSDRSWKLNSSNMDLIYGNAKLTICAADGHDFQAGLLNIWGRTYQQRVVKYSNKLELMVSEIVESYIEPSAWNSRAWTFQERVLSKKTLIFAGGRAFFQCRSTTMRDDVYHGRRRIGWTTDHSAASARFLSGLDERAITVYMKSVRLYTSRKLTRPDNILAAFQGIGNALSTRLGSTLIHGIPRSHFDLGLLWQPVSKASLRLIADEVNHRPLSLGGVRKFPSWSWCGWQDATITYPAPLIEDIVINTHEWLANHTWIKWYIRDGYGNLSPVWDGSLIEGAQASAENSRYRGYATTDLEAQHAGRDVYGRSRATLERLCPQALQQTVFTKTLSEFPFGVHVNERANHPDLQYGDQPFLQFWTWSALFKIMERSDDNSLCSSDETKLSQYTIVDHNGEWCGSIALDGHPRRNGEHEFIAISEAKRLNLGEQLSWSYYIPMDVDESEWDVYHVLMINTESTGISYRVGLGKVFKSAFENSCGREKEWKEFILG